MSLRWPSNCNQAPKRSTEDFSVIEMGEEKRKKRDEKKRTEEKRKEGKRSEEKRGEDPS